jgi:hypothetical protein
VDVYRFLVGLASNNRRVRTAQHMDPTSATSLKSA